MDCHCREERMMINYKNLLGLRESIKITFLQRVLYFLGVPGCYWKKGPTFTRHQLIMTILMFVTMAAQNVILFLSIMRCENEGTVCIKSNISVGVTRVLRYLFWISCYRNKDRFQDMWESFDAYCRRRIVVAVQRVGDIFTIIAVVGMALLCVTNVVMFVYGSELFIFKTNLFWLDLALKISYTIGIITFVVLMPNLTFLPFICWCRILSSSLRSLRNVGTFVRRHSDVHATFRVVQRAYAFPLLMQTCICFADMLSPLAGGFKHYSSSNYYAVNAVSTFLNVATLTAVMLAASEVHNADVELRARVKNLAFSFDSEVSRVLKNYLESKEEMTFSACKVFAFTRSLPLSFFGALLTYNLLIIQYNNY